jgi:uncharacterized protein YraI
MEEERPLNDAGETFENPEPATMITAEQTDNGRAKSSISRLMILGVVLIISLLVAGLFLPPISLAQRLGFGDGVAQESESAAEAGDELTLHLSDESANVDVAVVSAAQLAEDEEMAPLAAAIPGSAELRSEIYLINYEGAAPQGRISIAVPEDAGPQQTLDLYGWDGSTWAFIPLRSTAQDRWESSSGPLPGAVALMQTAAPQDVAVGAEVLPAQELPAPVLPHLTEVMAGTLTLGADGQLSGDVAELSEGGYRQYVQATNVGIVVDQGALGALLSDEALLLRHVDALVDAAAPYAGLNLDYQGVPAGQRQAFTNFVEDLAEALQAQDKQLLVTLNTPAPLDSGTWDTAGQDWQAIGQAADAVYVRLPLNPGDYAEEGTAQQLVEWAVTQIHRHKLVLLVTANAVDAVGGTYRELPNAAALANFGELSFTEGAAEVEAGASVEVGLSGTAGPLEWDNDSSMYRYTYEEAGQEHTVWLGNETAVSHRLSLAQPYHLRGVALRGLGHATEGQGYAAAIESYVGAAAAPEPDGAAIVWTVQDDEESVVASSSGEALSYRWEDAREPGSYTIKAVFAQGEAVAELGSLAVEVSAVSTPTPTPQPTEAATAEEEEPAQAAAATATPAPTAAQLDPGQADAVINIASNFRRGPGLGYGVIEVLPAGTQLALTGRNAAADWFQVQVVDGGQEGWLYGELLTINSSVDVDALAVVEVDPPTVGDDPAPPPPPPIANTGFELGGQTHTLANPTLMREAGMNWVKFQHKWGPGDSPDAVAGRIDHAHGNGFKVLLSIPGGNYPSSIDFDAYVEFLRGVAALGPDAIEIWNEMNIDREWPAGQIDPNSYVNNMLAPAYQAIKSVNPNVMVISGAPAPTGADNGTNVWADDRYMAGVAAAGGANYMDCIGVHHNAGATPPGASSGHPAGNNHYSWYFQPTLNMYYNTFGGARPVCFTELGYLSGQDFGGVPGGFSWASGTTVSQHAQWLGEAVSLAGNSGQVRLVIIFNVDFTLYGEDPQAGYAMLRPDGSCPACATLRAAMGQ